MGSVCKSTEAMSMICIHSAALQRGSGFLAPSACDICGLESGV